VGTGSFLTESKYRRKMEVGRVDGKGLGGEAKWPTTSFLVVCLELLFVRRKCIYSYAGDGGGVLEEKFMVRRIGGTHVVIWS